MIVAGDLDLLLRQQNVTISLRPVAGRVVGRGRWSFFNKVVRDVRHRIVQHAAAARVLTNVLGAHLAVYLDARQFDLAHLLADVVLDAGQTGDPAAVRWQDNASCGDHVALEQLEPLVVRERVVLVANEAAVRHHRRRPCRRGARRHETVLLAVATELLVRCWKLVPVRGQALTASAVVHPTIYRL